MFSSEVVSLVGLISEAAADVVMLEGQLVVPIRSVGVGPTLNIRGGAEAAGGGGITGSGRSFRPVEGLSSVQANAVVFEPHVGNLEPKLQVTIRLRYEDIAGVTHATDLGYSDSARPSNARPSNRPSISRTRRSRPRMLTRVSLRSPLPHSCWRASGSLCALDYASASDVTVTVAQCP
jgi:hypothetical protein